jgi:hypothetical protein
MLLLGGGFGADPDFHWQCLPEHRRYCSTIRHENGREYHSNNAGDSRRADLQLQAGARCPTGVIS